MTVSELAEVLKQYQRRLLPTELVNSMDAEDILWSYLKCAECQEEFVANFVPLVLAVKSSQEFVEACNVLIAMHQIEAHGVAVFPGDPEKKGTQLTLEELRRQLPPGICS